jgi:hypothetical protein
MSPTSSWPWQPPIWNFANFLVNNLVLPEPSARRLHRFSPAWRLQRASTQRRFPMWWLHSAATSPMAFTTTQLASIPSCITRTIPDANRVY